MTDKINSFSFPKTTTFEAAGQDQKGVDNTNRTLHSAAPLNTLASDRDAVKIAIQAGKINSTDNIHYENLNEDFATAVSNLRVPRASNSFLHSIGRAFLSIINFFKGVRSSDTLSTQEKLNELRGKRAKPLYDNTTTQPLFGGEKQADKFQATYVPHFEIKTYGTLAGINDAEIKKFDGVNGPNPQNPEELSKILFGANKTPKLSDIKQDPELQDCWFLSSIGAVLSSQGTEGITRLFSPSMHNGNVNVRLGGNIYEVPLGEIKDKHSNYTFGSKSKPWVKVLELAMMMHKLTGINGQVNTTTIATNSSMALSDAYHGLGALMGYTIAQSNSRNPYVGQPLAAYNAGDAFNMVKDGLDSGYPVVLGHRGGIWASLSDGVASGHAITVLSADSATQKVTVLDPYGEVKTLSASDLKNCTLYANTKAVNDMKNTEPQPVKDNNVTEDQMNEMINNNDDDF
ncbi:MAG: hypothetical protein K6F05_00230 [Succinivibrio sp.]|nr:hypothetical protein [Succinivibrio sp.]